MITFSNMDIGTCNAYTRENLASRENSNFNLKYVT